MEQLQALNIRTMKWPALSPDLNPIETCWSWIKDYYQEVYGERRFSSKELKEKIEEAFRMAVTPERLRGLLNTMPYRCRAVIDADGGATKW